MRAMLRAMLKGYYYKKESKTKQNQASVTTRSLLKAILKKQSLRGARSCLSASCSCSWRCPPALSEGVL
jgi:hypothetical protein